MNLPAQSLSPASLTALTEAAAAINSTLELGTVKQTIARLACAVTHAEASSVFSYEAKARRLCAVAATGARREALVGREFDAHLGIAGHIIRTGEPLNLVDAPSHPRFAREMDAIGALRTRTLLAVPMLHRGGAVGVIEVVNRLDEREFAESDVKLLQVFAALAVSATQNAQAHEELKRRYEGLRDSVLQRTAIIGGSEQIKNVLALCDRVGPSNATVLILGETGTGKELCARYVHGVSRRREETFVAVNCAALTETLLESELFGHEKGAFTGAHAQRRGWFELADHGTLFLDEIGDISRAMQVKLLRVLQEREFVRVGGGQPISSDVRVIAATNRNLKNMVIDGLFREDLYYRLSVFPIQLPPLSERREDIPLLVEHFLARAVRDFRAPALKVAPLTMEALTRYPWPGNIRELQNVIERSVLMADSEVLQPHHLPYDIQAATASEAASANGSTLLGQEKALILKTLHEQGWNQSQAARVLGITRDHLRHRIRKYGLQKPSLSAEAAGPTPAASPTDRSTPVH